MFAERRLLWRVEVLSCSLQEVQLVLKLWRHRLIHTVSNSMVAAPYVLYLKVAGLPVPFCAADELHNALVLPANRDGGEERRQQQHLQAGAQPRLGQGLQKEIETGQARLHPNDVAGNLRYL